MANVNIQLGYKDSAWFAANATLVLLAGQIVYLQQTGQYKIGNGVTQLQNLEFKGAKANLVDATVVNKTGVNLLASNYQAVKVSTAQGQRLAVDFAQANNDNNSADTIGLVNQNININQEGTITILGQITEINTTGSLQGETWVDGDVLYLSPTTPGAITKVKPTGATGHIVVLGYVEYAHAVHGKIYVKVMNGWELEELHNVSDISYNPPIDADSLLIKDSTASLWKRLTIANLKTFLTGLYVSLTGNQTIAGIKTFSDNILFNNATVKASLQPVPTIPSYMGLFLNVNPNSSNYALVNDGSGNTFLNGVSNLYISANATNLARFGALFQLHTPVAASSGSIVKWQLTVPVDTGLTASTNIPNFKVNGANKQWNSGILTTQYFNYFTTNTVAFTSASTATDVFNLFIEAPTAGTNATITNAYSLGTNGKAKFGGNVELTQTVTAETVTSDTTVTIKINGVNYKLLAKS